MAFFEEAVRRSFDFLYKEKGYAEPEVEFARDFFLVYNGPSEDLQIAIGWERSCFLPFVFIGLGEDRVSLPQVLSRLGIASESKRFQHCEKLLQNEFPGIREFWIHHQRKREILDEYPRFLEAYAAALRANYDAVMREVRSTPPPVVGPSSEIRAVH